MFQLHTPDYRGNTIAHCNHSGLLGCIMLHVMLSYGRIICTTAGWQLQIIIWHNVFNQRGVNDFLGCAFFKLHTHSRILLRLLNPLKGTKTAV